MRLVVKWVIPLRKFSHANPVQMEYINPPPVYNVDISTFDELKVAIFQETNILPAEQLYNHSTNNERYRIGRAVEKLDVLKEGQTILLRKSMPHTLELIRVQKERIDILENKIKHLERTLKRR